MMMMMMMAMMAASLARHDIYLRSSYKQQWLHFWHTVKYFCVGLYIDK